VKILLINPWEDDYLPPPAIGYLQATCKYWGADVQVANLQQAMTIDDSFDLIGVTFHSFSVKYARQLRDKFQGHLICGGHHPSAIPEQMLAVGYDQVVQGEGENAIISILQGNADRIVKNCDHQYFNGINDIPFPDYSGISFSGVIGISIITSRGCPFRCNFCASTDFWGHSYRMRSADNVLLEIEKRKSEGYNTWIFEDDNFLANEKRAYEICSRLDGRLTWQCIARAESLNIELCAELFRAGCRKVWIGVESLSQEALDRCNKNTTVEKMLSGIKNANDVGMNTMSLFLVGLPGDTRKDIEITKAKIRGSAISEIGVNIAWILPGTEIYRKAKERGFDDNVYLESGAPFYTYEQSMETLKNWEYQIMTR
jgi:radical SAM superfamily enzyme YgiQ (UPF0313 family)